MSISAYLRNRSNELEQSINSLQTTKQQLADSYGSRHMEQSEVSLVSLLEQEVQIKQKELAEVRAVLKK